eukprot:scaffold2129_cov255-Pinguiococcus_pyrenoidosus.AAC.12
MLVSAGLEGSAATCDDVGEPQGLGHKSPVDARSSSGNGAHVAASPGEKERRSETRALASRAAN